MAQSTINIRVPTVESAAHWSAYARACDLSRHCWIVRTLDTACGLRSAAPALLNVPSYAEDPTEYITIKANPASVAAWRIAALRSGRPLNTWICFVLDFASHVPAVRGIAQRI